VIQNTFCHIPGIGLKTERLLWNAGILTWDEVIKNLTSNLPIGPGKARTTAKIIEESFDHLNHKNPHFFANLLPSNQHWRLFNEFRQFTAYLDIETTGSVTWEEHITTIALYDGNTIRYYVHGENLEEFEADIERYRVIVTFNGKSFDIPIIRNHFKISMRQVHIDLHYIMNYLGYKGGLKKCELQLGIDRGLLKGVDGYCAVLLWHDWVTNNNIKALETLLAYNIADTLNLEKLMIVAFNQLINETPFHISQKIAKWDPPANPFQADSETLDCIMRYLPIKNLST